MLMKEVFGYDNVKAQGIHQSNPKSNELIKVGEGVYDLYVEGNKKAIFKISNNMVDIRTPQNKFFNSVLEEEKYMAMFINLYKK
jgi:hypothetical protein